MVMQEITVQRAKEIAMSKSLQPGRVRGTGGIQFTKGGNSRLELIDWNEFERVISENDLAVYESNGWMKIMKRK